MQKLKDLKIDFEEPRILNMEDNDIIFLKEILENYIKIVSNRSATNLKKSISKDSEEIKMKKKY